MYGAIGGAAGSWAASELLADEIDSEAEATGVALGSAIGSTVGQAMLPPLVGSAIGSFVGSIVGGYLGEKWNEWENGATGLDIAVDIVESTWELPQYALNAILNVIPGMGKKPKIPEAYAKYEYNEEKGEYELVESHSRHGGSVSTAKEIAMGLGDAMQSLSVMYGGHVVGGYPDILVEHRADSWRVNGFVESDINYAIAKAALIGVLYTSVESGDADIHDALHASIKMQFFDEHYGLSSEKISIDRVQQDVMLVAERGAYDSNTAVFVSNATKDEDGNLLTGDVASEAESQLLSVYRQIMHAQEIGGEDGASIMANVVELTGAAAGASAETMVMLVRNDLLTALEANGLTDQLAAINNLKDFAAIKAWAEGFEVVGLREYIDMKLSSDPMSDEGLHYQSMLERSNTLRRYGSNLDEYKVDYEAKKLGVDLNDYGWEDFEFRLNDSVFTLIINNANRKVELPIDFSENGDYSLAHTHLPIAGSVMNLGEFIDKVGMADGSSISGADALYGLFGSKDVDIDSVVIDWNTSTKIKASSGADWIHSSSGNDVIKAGNGDDFIIEAAGNDDIDGGAGFDTLSYGQSEHAVYVDLYNSTASVITTEDDSKATEDNGESDWSVLEQNRVVRFEGVIGSSSDDILIGSIDRNELVGGQGDDQLQGGGGNDSLDGGDGKDVLSGGVGNDTASGGAGDDLLSGDRGDDILSGGAGADVLRGGEGNDRLSGGSGDDAITGDHGKDWLDGGAGDDELHGGDSNDQLHGGEGDDYLLGGNGYDKLDGGAGDDYLLGDTGNDSLRGGAGADYLDGGTQDDHLDGGEGDDYLRGGEGRDKLRGGEGADVLEGDAGNDILTGGKGDDALLGGSGDDSLDGGEGDDSLSGGEGRDVLIGGAGNDRLSGGGGRDVIDGGAGIDTVDYGYSAVGIHVTSHSQTGLWWVREHGGPTDSVADVENILATDFADVISTGAGDNVIHAGAGDDVLIGGSGADELRGGRGTDTASYVYSKAAVAISLAAGNASGGDAEGDKLFDIENITGSALDDFLAGDRGDNKLVGGAGADILAGGAGEDVLRGGTGDDELSGGAGADILDGGRGDSDIATYANSSAGVEVNLTTGVGLGGDAEGDRLTNIEQIEGSNFDDVLAGDAKNNVLSGGSGDDVIDGGAGRDELHGGAGSDYLDGGAGRDELYGGDGSDHLDGGDRDDKLYGGEGADELYGGAGMDKLYGGEGADELHGGNSHDRLEGGAGADWLYGDAGHDYLAGGLGNDRLDGGDGNDKLYGGDGADELYGGEGADKLHGGSGSDGLKGGAGEDELYGDAGNDYLAGGLDNDSLYGGEGRDRLYGEDGDDFLDGGLEDDSLYGGAGSDELHGGKGADILAGGLGNDALYGGSGADKLAGGSGDDHLAGDSGSDLLAGGEGRDTLLGGSGNDILQGDAGADELHGGSGFDKLYGGTGADNLYGGDNDDKLYGGAGADSLDGGSGDDRLYGDEGDDYLSGAAGADRLWGGAGADTLSGGSGRDQLIGGEGADSLLGGDDADKLLGDAGADRLYGDAGDDYLAGGTGADSLHGGAGTDELFGGEDNDELWGGAGADIVHGDAGDDYLDGGAGADDLYGGAGADTIYGGDGDDRVEGGAGADLLFGDAGADTIRAGAGDDEAHGGAGDDSLTLQGSFDDYEFIKFNEQLLAHDSASGEVKVIDSVEFFQFADGTNLSLLDIEQQLEELRQLEQESQEELDGYGNPSGPGKNLQHSAQSATVAMAAAYAAVLSTYTNAAAIAEHGYFSDENLTEINPLLLEALEQHWGIVNDADAESGASADAAEQAEPVAAADADGDYADDEAIEDEAAPADADSNPEPTADVGIDLDTGDSRASVPAAADASAEPEVAAEEEIVDTAAGDDSASAADDEASTTTEEDVTEVAEDPVAPARDNDNDYEFQSTVTELSPATLLEDGSVALDLRVSPGNIGSEISIFLSVPEGASLSNGVLQDDGRWQLSLADLADLRLQIAAHSNASFNIGVEVLEYSSDNMARTLSELPVTVTAVADAPELEVTAAAGTEDSAIALDIASSLVDSDGSETLQIYLEGVPTYAELSAGVLLEDGRWLLDSDDLAGLQLSLGANNSDDFTLTVRALSREAENGSVAETVTQLPVSVTALADAPELAVTAAAGAEGSAIALDIASGLIDADGSEILQIYLENVPTNASLSAGELLEDGRWLLSLDDLASLQLIPGTENSDDFTLIVRALSREAENGSVAETVAELPVTVNAVADAPELAVTAAAGTEDSAITLDIASSLADADGSETLEVYLEGVPSDASLSAGLLLDDGRWLLSSDELAGLQLTLGANSSDDLTLTVRALSREDENGSAAETLQELPVTVNAVADAPELAVSAAAGDEDKAIALDIASSLVDIDGSETLEVYLEGVPTDAELNAGELLEDGRWLLTPDDLIGLQLISSANNSDDLTLIVRALSSEDENGAHAETVLELPVSVNAVADAPELVVAAAAGTEDKAIALDIAATLVDVDASENLSVYIDNVPASARLSAGALLDDGRWLLLPGELDDLHLYPAENDDSNLLLEVRALSRESENGDLAETVSMLPITVQAVADAPELAVDSASGSEDSAIALDIATTLVDTDVSEQAYVYIEAVPEGAFLNNGSEVEAGIWRLTPDQLKGLTITPAANNDSDFDLVVRSVSVESANGDSAESVSSLRVEVEAVADAPALAVAALEANEDQVLPLNIDASALDADGSESLKIYVSGLLPGAALSAGLLLDDGRWLLNADELDGLRLNLPEHHSDDFSLMVKAVSTELINGAKAETVLELPVTINAVADAPELAVAAAVGDEDKAIALDIAASLIDFDGSETLEIYLEGVPADAELSAGERLDDGRWLLNPADLTGLQLIPSANNSDDFTLTVRALSSESERDSSAETVLELPVTVRAAADAPELTVMAAMGDEDKAITLDIASNLLDADGSETLQVYLEGVPANASLSAGKLLDDGRWLLNADDLVGLQLTPGANDSDDFRLTVRARSSEGENDSVAETVQELLVTVNAVVDAPELEVQAAAADEDSDIVLDIAAKLVDADGSETLQVYLEDVPPDATLSAGKLLDDGRWLLSPEELSDLQITPSRNDDSDFTLIVRALSREGETGSVAETVQELPVTVNAVADAPEVEIGTAAGDEDSIIALDISAALTDTDGSERLQIYIDNLPEGARLRGSTMEVAEGVFWVNSERLDELSVIPGPDNSDDFTLRVRVQSSEIWRQAIIPKPASDAEIENGLVAETVIELPVSVTAVADTPSLQTSRSRGDEDSAIALDISAHLSDTDGSEQLYIYVDNVPQGAALSAGTELDDGSWLLREYELAGLTITPPANSNDDFELTIRSRAVEDDNDDYSEKTATLQVLVNGIADVPYLSEDSSINVDEDQYTEIPLNINSHLIDTDGSERLVIYIDNVPSGATLNKGEPLSYDRSGESFWELSPEDLAGLSIALPKDFSGDFILDVSAAAIEGSSSNEYASTNSTISVHVNPIADEPVFVHIEAGYSYYSEQAVEVTSTEDWNFGDIIYGDNRDDELEGYWYNDWIYGEDGNDELFGKSGDDTIFGGNGDDKLWGYSSSSKNTDEGDDWLHGDGGDDYIDGSGGDDHIFGGSGADKLYGGNDNDTIYGDHGAGAVRRTPLMIKAEPSDADGSEVVEYYLISGVPTDSALSVGTISEVDGINIWQVSATEVHALELITPAWETDIAIDLEVSAVAIDSEVALELATEKLSFMITADADYGDDELYGGSGNDILYGNGGNDTLDGGYDDDDTLGGGYGDDVLYGNDDNDTLDGGYGDDVLYGNDDNDTLNGGYGNDYLYGGAGNDRILDWYGDNLLDGGDGDDWLEITRFGTAGNNSIYGGAGDDKLYAANGDDILNGGTGDDYLEGDYGDDVLYGGDGDDLLKGGDGVDLFFGGDGKDVLYIDADDIAYANEVDTLDKIASAAADFGGGAGVDALYLRTYGDDLITMNVALWNAEIVHGDSTQDYINGSGVLADLELHGGGGDDQLIGGDGNDILHGGSGTNMLMGGAGDDTIYATNYDSIDGGSGYDKIIFSSAPNNFNISSAAVEEIEYSLFDNATLILDEDYDADMVIKTGEGNDSITVGRGEDTIDGGRGYDTLHVKGSINDFNLLNESNNDLWKVVNNGGSYDWLSIVAPNGSSKTIAGFEYIQFDDYKLSMGGSNNDVEVIRGGYADDYIDKSSVIHDLELHGNGGNDTLIGGDGDDVLHGGIGFNVLKGGDGDDILDGGYGYSDILEGGAGDDIIYATKFATIDGGSGYDTVIFKSSLDHFNIPDATTNIEEIIYNFSNNITLALDEDYDTDIVIKTGLGDDFITVGSGNDTLDGGEGHDTLRMNGSINNFYSLNSANSDFWRVVNSGESYEWLSIVAPNGSSKTIADFEYIQFDDYTLAMDGSDDWYRANNAAPVAFDLNDDGTIGYINLADSPAAYDFSGDNISDLSAWVAPEDGFLTIDIDGDGVIERREELVLASWGELAIAEQDLRMDFDGNGVVELGDFDADGNGVLSDLEGLSYFDSNRDGTIDNNDEAWERFGVWQDTDSDGTCESEEFSDLDSIGITSVGLSSDGEGSSAADGDVTIYGEGSYTRSDDSIGISHDAAFRFLASDADAGEVRSARATNSDSEAAEVNADYTPAYSTAQIAADLALLRSDVAMQAGDKHEHSAEAMTQMVGQAHTLMAGNNTEVAEDMLAGIAAKAVVEPELAKACVIAAGYLAAASANVETLENSSNNNNNKNCELDLAEPENIFGF